MAEKADDNNAGHLAFSTTCGQNVKVNGTTAEWISNDSGGRVYLDKPIRATEEVILQLINSGHANVGIISKDPLTLPEYRYINNLKELRIMQSAKIHKRTGIIKIKRCRNGREILTECDEKVTKFKVEARELIWITVNIIFGSLVVKIDSRNVKYLPICGDNISFDKDKETAELKIANPCSVCFFEFPLTRNEQICFNVEPAVRAGKLSRNFSVKCAVSEQNPKDFLSQTGFYDLCSLPVYFLRQPTHKMKNEVKIGIDSVGVFKIQYEESDTQEETITFDKAYLLLEICRLTIKCTSRGRTADKQFNIPRERSLGQKLINNSDVANSTTATYVSEDPDYANCQQILKDIKKNVEDISVDETKFSLSDSSYFNVSDSSEFLPINNDSTLKCDSNDYVLSGIVRRLESVEEQVRNLSLDRSRGDIIEKQIQEIKSLLCVRSKDSTTREDSLTDVIQKNFTDVTDLLETVPFLDVLFENRFITSQDYEKIRTLSKTERVDANRELALLVMRRGNLTVSMFKDLLLKTHQEGLLEKMFPTQYEA